MNVTRKYIFVLNQNLNSLKLVNNKKESPWSPLRSSVSYISSISDPGRKAFLSTSDSFLRRTIFCRDKQSCRLGDQGPVSAQSFLFFCFPLDMPGYEPPLRQHCVKVLLNKSYRLLVDRCFCTSNVSFARAGFFTLFSFSTRMRGSRLVLRGYGCHCSIIIFSSSLFTSLPISI